VARLVSFPRLQRRIPGRANFRIFTRPAGIGRIRLILAADCSRAAVYRDRLSHMPLVAGNRVRDQSFAAPHFTFSVWQSAARFSRGSSIPWITLGDFFAD
jgi:hypothetical protein